MRVDLVGLATLPVGSLGALHLDHHQPGSLDRPGQPDPVAAGAFQSDHDLGAGRMVRDPRQRLGVTGLIVVDHDRRDRHAARRGDL
jgi:hypothetical protein